MASSDLRNRVKKIFISKQDYPTSWTAFAGDGNNNLVVKNKPGYIYYRVGTSIGKAFCNKSIVYDSIILVGIDPVQPSIVQVLTGVASPTNVAETNASGSTTTPGGPAPANRYRWMAPNGGQDPLFSELRQLMPLRMTPYNGMMVNIYKGRIWSGTEWIDYDGSTNFDLTDDIPTTSGDSVYVLFTMDNTGTPIKTVGTPALSTAITLADIPTIPSGTVFCSWAVKLYYGETAILDTEDECVDLRFPGLPIGGGGGSGGSGDVIAPSSATTGHLAVFGSDRYHIEDGGPLGSGTGDMVGPGSATDGNLAVFDGTTGKLIKDGGPMSGGGYTQGASLLPYTFTFSQSVDYPALWGATVNYDTDSMYDSGDHTKLTCQTDGIYQISVCVVFYNPTDDLSISVCINGNPITKVFAYKGIATVSLPWSLSNGDYVQITCRDNTAGGSNQATGSYFAAQRIG